MHLIAVWLDDQHAPRRMFQCFPPLKPHEYHYLCRHGEDRHFAYYAVRDSTQLDMRDDLDWTIHDGAGTAIPWGVWRRRGYPCMTCGASIMHSPTTGGGQITTEEEQYAYGTTHVPVAK